MPESHGCRSTAPRASRQLWDAAQAGDHETARDLHEKLMPVWDAVGVDNMPSLVKYAQRLQGIETGYARKPTAPATDEQKRLVHAALENLNLVTKR